MTRAIAFAVALAQTVSIARADPTPDSPTQGAGRARLAPVLPTLRLSGSTDGAGIIQASLDLVVGIADDWDLAITPTYVGAAPSIAQLFSSSDNAGANKPWALGGSVTFIQLGAGASDQRPGSGGAMDQVKKRAYEICMSRCQGDNASDDERKFCAENARLSPYEIDPQRFCIKGQALLLEKDVLIREQRAAFPQVQISVGALAGSNDFPYFTTNSDHQLFPHDESHVDYAVAGSVTYVRRNTGFTFELPLLWTARWLPSSDQLSICASAGTFFAGNQMLSTGMACANAVIGPPHQDSRVFTTAQFGYVSRPSGFWRASIGPLLAYDDNGTLQSFTAAGLAATVADTSLTVGIQSAIYLNFVRAPDGTVGDYRGLIRVAPTVQWVQARGGGWDTQFFVVVSLLGQRTLFARALDWLQ